MSTCEIPSISKYGILKPHQNDNHKSAVIYKKKALKTSKQNIVELDPIFSSDEIAECFIRKEDSKTYKFNNIESKDKSSFIIKNKWYGIIEDIDKDVIYCRLQDVTTKYNESIELSLEDFDKEEIPMVTPGRTFTYFIGYATTNHGQRVKSALIKLDTIVPVINEFKNTEYIELFNNLKNEYTSKAG